MAISSPGIGSNLDVNSIVSQLMTVEQRPLTLLARQEAGLQAKVSALGALKGAVASLQGAMQGLKNPARFQGYASSASDTSVISASAGKDASAGSHNIAVTNLAQQQIVATAGVASDTTALSTGTLTLRAGSGASVNVTIDSGNNTLRGIRDAINQSGADVSATLVNDGSATPWRLVLTATSPGAANTITITNGLAPGEFKDAIDNRAQTQAARDAALSIDGIAVTSASNTVSDAIGGVTLNLLKPGASTLNITRDTAGAQASVQAFVKAYNDINKSLAELVRYDPASKRSGPFQGEAMVVAFQSRIRQALSSELTGADGSSDGLTRLSQAGIAFQKDGSLALDSAKLSAAMDKHFADLGALFAPRGAVDNTLFTYAGASSDTAPGQYRVGITSAATQGAATASSAAASTTIDGTNDDLTLTVDGVGSGVLRIAHGAYDAQGLANALANAIRTSAAFTAAGITATVSVDGGHIKVASARHGAESSVRAIAGTGAIAAGFNSSESGAGADVAGYFELNGTRLQAQGAGQLLTGQAGSAATGLQVKYTGTAVQIPAGGATVSLSDGYATRLERVATAFLATNGPADSRGDGIDAGLKNIAQRRDVLNRRLVDTERRLRAQFTALDGIVSRMNTTSTFLSQQLTRLTQTK